MPIELRDPSAVVQAIIDRVGPDLRVATPLAQRSRTGSVTAE